MNELIPLNTHEVLLSRELPLSIEELGIAQLSPANNRRLFLVLIPIALLFFLKDKGPVLVPKPRLSTQSYNQKLTALKPMPSPMSNFDVNAIDRLARILEGVKKVSSIQDLSKTIAKARNSSGKFNKEILHEMIALLGDNLSEENKAQIQNITHMLSMMDKIKDVKKVLDLQKQMKSEGGGDASMQIDAMIEAIKPMLPEEQAKNIDQFKKMAQMMKLMAMFDTAKAGSDAEDEDNDKK
ncbi:hypothetical protein [Thermotalea metallivorans]|uniref:Uncharacterized protein n=1 Tax=Thermotalea metallivorans TaxID=520762 RepID=A0A140LEJ3_9FIRM|nr:hypothetical protein [Thermotalea metallivorans]KXG78968.1 hypothetical protein AN619_01280 [Thermotalea metallivorans]